MVPLIPNLEVIRSQLSPPATTYVVEQSSPSYPKQMELPTTRLEHVESMMPLLIAASWYLNVDG